MGARCVDRRRVGVPEAASAGGRRGCFLARSAVRAAARLGIDADWLEATFISDLTDAERGEAIMLFLRIVVLLDELCDAREAEARLWLRAQSPALDAVPLDLMSSREGLGRVLSHLIAVHQERARAEQATCHARPVAAKRGRSP